MHAAAAAARTGVAVFVVVSVINAARKTWSMAAVAAAAATVAAVNARDDARVLCLEQTLVLVEQQTGTVKILTGAIPPVRLNLQQGLIVVGVQDGRYNPVNFLPGSEIRQGVKAVDVSLDGVAGHVCVQGLV